MGDGALTWTQVSQTLRQTSLPPPVPVPVPSRTAAAPSSSPGVRGGPGVAGVVHVHISGSGGSTMCQVARQQPVPSGARGCSGHAYACLLPCGSPFDWKSLAFVGLSCHGGGVGAGTTCHSFAANMAARGYGVMGAYETVLPEIHTEDYGAQLQRVHETLRHRQTLCARPGFDALCPVRRLDPFDPHSGRNATCWLVAGGAPSIFDELWPLESWRPLSTYCANLRYTFVMHEPLRRLVGQLLARCPLWEFHRGACVQWAVDALRTIYSSDLLIEHDSKYLFFGTPSASNYYTRSLLGPRVFFSRLGALRAEHYEAAKLMLSQYAFVLPLKSLDSAISHVMPTALNWHVRGTNASMHTNRHTTKHVEKGRDDVLKAVGGLLREHNAWDIRLYEWIVARCSDT